MAATLALIASVLMRDTIRLLILNRFGTTVTNLTLFLLVVLQSSVMQIRKKESFLRICLAQLFILVWLFLYIV